jgi:glutathione S-transferase
VAREAGIPIELKKTSTKDKTIEGGGDFWKVNGKGYVPALELDDGQVLTEGPAIVQYLADKVPAKNLAPANGTMARYRVQEWLNFITSELHKGIGGLFNPAMPEDGKTVIRARAAAKLKWVDEQLEGKQYLMGDVFSIADPYLFTMITWTAHTGIDISAMKNLGAYQARMAARPSVQAAMKAEGLLK